MSARGLRRWRALGGTGIALGLLLALVGCIGQPAVPVATPTAPLSPSVAPTASDLLPSATPTVMRSPQAQPTVPGSESSTPTALLLTPSPTAPGPTVTPAGTVTGTLFAWPESPLDHTENLLVLGIDRRPGEVAWRTDTIMVVAVDVPGQRVGIVSIPRDLYVKIPGYGLGRINQADFIGETNGYPGGGPALLRRVLTETLGIPTRHYIRVRLEGLVRLVDTLGGVTVVLDCPLYEQTPNDASPNGLEDWSLPAGPVVLDGEAARKFATYRYVTSDFGRARRQQQLIWAIRDRALQLDIIPRIPELWQAFSAMFNTDLGLLDIVRLATFGAGLRPESVHGVVLDDDVMAYHITPEGAWVLVIADYEGIAARKAQIFAQRPLASLNVSEAGGECPPPPTPAPTFTPTPPAAQEPTATPAP